MSSSSTCQSDLVFTVSGNSRSRRTLAIKVQKCILALDTQNNPSTPARCAIIRGKAGVTVRDLDRQLLINGRQNTLHWLQAGDRIEFPNSVILEVAQLGCFDELAGLVLDSTVTSCDTPQWGDQLIDHQPDLLDEKTLESATASNEDASCEAVQQSLLARPTVITDFDAQPVAEHVEKRFAAIEQRLDDLSDQLATLITLAGCGQFSTEKLAENDWQEQMSVTPLLGLGTLTKFQDSEVKTEVPTPSEDAACETTTLVGQKFKPATSPWQAGSSEIPNTAEKEKQVEPPATFVALFSPNSFATTNPNRDAQELVSAATESHPIENRDAEKGNDFAPITNNDTLLRQIAELQRTLNLPEIHPATNPLVSAIQTVDETHSPANGSEVNDEDPKRHEKSTAQPSSLGSPTESLIDISSLARKYSALAGEISNLAELTDLPAPTSAPINPVESKEDPVDSLLQRLYCEGSVCSTKPAVADDRSVATDTIADSSPPWAIFSPVTPAYSSDSTSESTSYANTQFGYSVGNSAPPSASFDVSSAANNPTSFPGEPELSTPLPYRTGEPSHSIGELSQVSAQHDRMSREGDGSDLWSRLKKDIQSQTSEFTSPGLEQDLSDSTAVSQSDSSATQSEYSSNFTTPALDQSQAPASDSIEDYMSQLFERMQISKETYVPTAAKPKAIVKEVEAPQETEQSRLAPENDLISAEDYVPKQKAQKLESLDTMREIANSSARSAVAFSDLDRRRTRGLMQVAISGGAMLMSLYYLFFVCKESGDAASIIGCLSLLIAGIVGFLGFRSLNGLQPLAKFISRQEDENQ